ncbi:ATP-binding protein [Endozoicomonas sp. 4G]|uniref:ATP-binding protein n=1 Tax=Endozoicomonas sp. 4G TaxID=2872754 RepID=UPI002078E0CF|nr:ATP-binding protein [Endozoicomonas sp. 4G]
MTFFPRYLQPKINEALQDTPVVCLLGARQVGKSTLCRELSPERAYLTFDDSSVLQAAKDDPAGFVQNLPEYVTLDEVQRVPELLFAIKAEVDRNRKPGRFLLTGSANLMLLPRVKESLAGRIEILHLQPLTEAEKESIPPVFLQRLFTQTLSASIKGEQKEIHGIAERVCQGGFPEPNTHTPHRARQWFNQYLQTIIQNDIRDIANIRDEDKMLKLAELLSLRTGNLLNISSIATDLKIRRETTDKYISILEHLFLFYRLPAWHNNAAKRLVKAPKIHIADSGLATMLDRLKAEEWRDYSTPFGPVLESFVIQQIRAQTEWLDDPVHLSHYRDKNKVEVDLVIEYNRDIYGIEIKKAISIQEKDGEGLRCLADQAGERFKGGVLIYCGNNALPLKTENCMAVPVDWLWRNDI